MQPGPEVVDEVNFEEIDVRLQSFPASHDFFDDHGFFTNQREDINDEDEWEDDDDDDEDEDDVYDRYGGHSEPECRQQ